MFPSILAAMSNKLLKQISCIVARGRQEADRLLASLDAKHEARLHTQEWVLPVMDSVILAWIRANTGRMRRAALIDMQQNLLIHGENVQVMKALLAGDDAMQSLRGKVDLICIHTPSDCHEGGSPIFPWMLWERNEEDVEPRLARGVLQLMLMRELLSKSGKIYIGGRWCMGVFVTAIMNEIFAGDHLSAFEWPGQGLLLARTPSFLPNNDSKGRHFAGQESCCRLEEIILRFTAPESIVVDFFGASGNTAAVAERLGRRWIVSDVNGAACMRIRERLLDQNAEPFLYQSIGKGEPDAACFLPIALTTDGIT